nr:reverse transcriptase domain-containing protein [Tanacetum cinerariifolium]
MQTRSSSNFVSESSTNPISTNLKRRNRRRSKPRVEPFSIVEIPIVTMVDNRTMEEMIQAPTEGITSTLKFRDVSNDAIKLMLFPYSLEGAAKIWTPRDALTVIKNKSKVRYSQNKPVASKVRTTSSGSSSSTDARIDKLTVTIPNLVETFNKKMTTPATVKAVEETCVICGVVDYVVDPRVPLILERPFLRTERALIDVYGEELTLRVDEEAITFKVGQTSKYSYNDVESINRIDVIGVACEEYVQEVLGFFDNSKSGNPTLISDPIIALSSSSLTPFDGGDLEEIEACLTSKLIPPGIDDADFDLEGEIHILEELLNNDPSSSPLNPKELNMEEIKTVKSSIDEPPELELKDLPSHLEYAFLEGTDKFSDIISKELRDEEKSALLKFSSHTNEPSHGKSSTLREVIKLLDSGFIYPISDSPWVSLIHCVPKRDGMTVVENKDNELIPTRTFAYRSMPFGLCNAPDMFQRCMMAIFHDMIKKTMEVFMDNFSVFGDSFSSCLSHLEKILKRYEDTNLVLNWEKCHFIVKEGIVLDHKISKSGIKADRAKVDVIAKLPHPTSVKGAKNLAADHLSRLENPHQDELEKKEITETFPLETFGMIAFRSDSSTIWFANIANYHAENFIVKRDVIPAKEEIL